MSAPAYAMPDEACKTARDFLDHILAAIDYDIPSAASASVPGFNNFVFRGQAKADWHLLPKAHRVDRAPPWLWEYALQGTSFLSPRDERERRMYLADHVFEELLTVHRFLECADKLGLPTPINYHYFGLHMTDINDLWKNPTTSRAYVEDFPDEQLLPAFALAQHHGVPTRLLDWTESPLVAAFFAAEQVSSISLGDRVDSDTMGIVRLNLGKLEERGFRLVRAPRAGNEFLRAQQGIFTLDRHANEFFFDHGRWPTINDRSALLPGLCRITLPVSEADKLLKLLFKFNVTRHHLMPTLGNAAEYVRYLKALF